jgi:Flp pilus assembly protein TadB
MIFRRQSAISTKTATRPPDLKTSMTALKQETSSQAGESFGAQAPIALLGLAAIAIIALINANSRPAPVVQPQVIASACVSCGTVVAVRRSAHSSPVFFVEVQMLDGSTRVVQQLAAGFKVGDVVLVTGNALSLRPQPS